MTDNTVGLMSKPWSKFLTRFVEIDIVKTCKWTEIHQLAHICRRYEKLYGRKFIFSMRTAPSKCPELVLVKKMCAMLGTSNPKTIREYVDWVYDAKIVPKNMKIRSLAFFVTPGLGNEFFIHRTEKNRIQKSTELPDEYRSIVEGLGLPIFTYGDLAFMCNALEEQPENESRLPYKQLFDKLYAIGLDPIALKELR